MAQAKRKRRTKHRGNAVGMVEVRGRTGRKPTAAEKKGTPKTDARSRREARLNTPPTWKNAFVRAGVAAAMFVALLLLFFKQDPAQTFAIGVVMLLFYIPMSYYLDLAVYRRNQRKKTSG
jgi:hypothetical protein